MRIINKYVELAFNPDKPDEVELDFKVSNQKLMVTKQETEHLYLHLRCLYED